MKNQLIKVQFPSLNKNCTMDVNDEEILKSNNINRCYVEKSVTLNIKEFNKVKNSLMDNNELWKNDAGENIGGSTCDEMTDEEFHEAFYKDTENSKELKNKYYNNFYTHVIKVKSEYDDTFYVNTEGYGYARYVGRDYYIKA